MKSMDEELKEALQSIVVEKDEKEISEFLEFLESNPENSEVSLNATTGRCHFSLLSPLFPPTTSRAHFSLSLFSLFLFFFLKISKKKKGNDEEERSIEILKDADFEETN